MGQPMREIDISDLLGIWFHDVRVNNICIDYFKREVALECVLPIGFWNSPNREGLSEGDKEGTLVFTGLLYIVIEPPDETYCYEDSKGIEISGEGSIQRGEFKSPLPKLPRDLPEDAFIHYFHVSEWNAGFFVAATGVHFKST